MGAVGPDQRPGDLLLLGPSGQERMVVIKPGLTREEEGKNMSPDKKGRMRTEQSGMHVL